MLEEVGFVDVRIGPACDTFGQASGEKSARAFGCRPGTACAKPDAGRHAAGRLKGQGEQGEQG